MKRLDNITDKKYIHLLVDEELKSKLIDIAREKCLPLNSLIRIILIEYLDAKEKDER